jgi:hypothetical protein
VKARNWDGTLLPEPKVATPDLFRVLRQRRLLPLNAKPSVGSLEGDTLICSFLLLERPPVHPCSYNLQTARFWFSSYIQQSHWWVSAAGSFYELPRSLPCRHGLEDFGHSRSNRVGQSIASAFISTLFPLWHYRGKLTLTVQPRCPTRFASSRDPPWASEIWRESTSPIPLPPGFVV